MNWLRTLREERGFRTQEDLAKAAGVARTTIAKIESGAIGPTINTAPGIARALGMSIEDLRALAAAAKSEAKSRRLPAKNTAQIDKIIAQAISLDPKLIAAREAVEAAQKHLKKAELDAIERLRAALAAAYAEVPK